MRATPVRSGHYRARIGREADQARVIAVALAHELADIPFPAMTHLGGAGIAQMRVVLPYNDLASAIPLVEMSREGMQCLSHVAITQIPGRRSAPEHGTIVFLGIANQPGVELGREKLVFGNVPVPVHVLVRPALQFRELLNHFLLAGRRGAKSGCIAVSLFVLSVMIE